VHLNCTVHWAWSTPSQASALSTQCTTDLEHSHALSTQCRLTWQALALSATELLSIKVQVRASCVVLVGGERNPASLVPSFRVRGRELEGNPASLTLSFRLRGRELEGKRWATVAQANGLRMGRGSRRHPGPVWHAENWLDKQHTISSIVPRCACRELDRRRGAKAA